ncbi:MAG: hypothetical protein ACREAC_18485, partial [Blastocatellia bacterium]
ASQILGTLDATLRRYINSRVTKHTGWKYRNGNKRRVPFPNQSSVGAKRHFGDIKLLMLTHAPENLRYVKWDPVNIRALDWHAPVVQSARSVGNMASQIEPESCHS